MSARIQADVWRQKGPRPDGNDTRVYDYTVEVYVDILPQT